MIATVGNDHREEVTMDGNVNVPHNYHLSFIIPLKNEGLYRGQKWLHQAPIPSCSKALTIPNPSGGFEWCRIEVSFETPLT